MEKLPIAVIGVGNLGAEHARIYSRLKTVDLVGVCDIDESRVKSLAKMFRTHAFTDYRDLLSRVKAVSVVVPTVSHYQIAKDFLLSGVNTLIEKPITTTIQQADELLSLAKSNRLVLRVGHVERFNSIIKALKKLVGQPKFIEIHRLGPFNPRTTDVGVVLDLMIHDLDIILDLVDSEVESLDAVGASILSKHEDIANARIKFKNGCCANLNASRLTRERTRKIRIFQEDAYISLDYLHQSGHIHRKAGPKIVTHHINTKKEEPLKLELEAFVDSVLEGADPPPVDRGARDALKIALDIVSKIKKASPASNLKGAMSKKVMIIAGEASGDLYGSTLAEAIHNLNPNIEISGIGGTLMGQAGVKLYHDVVGLAVIGFAEVLKNYKKFKSILNSLLDEIDQNPPDVIILIDYPGFNLRFARQIKKRSIPIIYYISPQVWAWGKNRIKTISHLVDKMIVVFDFEKGLYKDHKLDVEFIGHPLLDIVKPTMAVKKAYSYFNLKSGRPTIGLLPGSRENEIRRHLPIMLEAARLINQKVGKVQFILHKAPTVPNEIFHRSLKEVNVPIQISSDNKTYDVMNVADFLLVASGTATLEGAILTKPMIILYKLNFLSWLLAKLLVKIPYIGLVNVVAGRKICPEFIQYNANPENIATETISLLQDEKRLSQIKSDLSSIKERLGTPGATTRCAELILKFLS